MRSAFPLLAISFLAFTACQTTGPTMNPKAAAPITTFSAAEGVTPAAGNIVPPPNARDCDTPIGRIPHGGRLTGYLSPSAPVGGNCQPGPLICNDGVWSGAFVHPGCTVLKE